MGDNQNGKETAVPIARSLTGAEAHTEKELEEIKQHVRDEVAACRQRGTPGESHELERALEVLFAFMGAAIKHNAPLGEPIERVELGLGLIEVLLKSERVVLVDDFRFRVVWQ